MSEENLPQGMTALTLEIKDMTAIIPQEQFNEEWTALLASLGLEPVPAGRRPLKRPIVAEDWSSTLIASPRRGQARHLETEMAATRRSFGSLAFMTRVRVFGRVLVAVAITATCPARAEAGLVRVKLKNGTCVVGELVGRDGGAVTVFPEFGKLTSYASSDVVECADLEPICDELRRKARAATGASDWLAIASALAKEGLTHGNSSFLLTCVDHVIDLEPDNVEARTLGGFTKHVRQKDGRSFWRSDRPDGDGDGGDFLLRAVTIPDPRYEICANCDREHLQRYADGISAFEAAFEVFLKRDCHIESLPWRSRVCLKCGGSGQAEDDETICPDCVGGIRPFGVRIIGNKRERSWSRDGHGGRGGDDGGPFSVVHDPLGTGSVYETIAWHQTLQLLACLGDRESNFDTRPAWLTTGLATLLSEGIDRADAAGITSGSSVRPMMTGLVVHAPADRLARLKKYLEPGSPMFRPLRTVVGSGWSVHVKDRVLLDYEWSIAFFMIYAKAPVAFHGRDLDLNAAFRAFLLKNLAKGALTADTPENCDAAFAAACGIRGTLETDELFAALEESWKGFIKGLPLESQALTADGDRLVSKVHGFALTPRTDSSSRFKPHPIERYRLKTSAPFCQVGGIEDEASKSRLTISVFKNVEHLDCGHALDTTLDALSAVAWRTIKLHGKSGSEMKAHGLNIEARTAELTVRDLDGYDEQPRSERRVVMRVATTADRVYRLVASCDEDESEKSDGVMKELRALLDTFEVAP